ncbi:hypothetical protein MUP07_10960 [Candidatus Bathyarchaeota archaeon]|nr:hypothetical protein [Candidatus Bathyarchaeota archaeon]
MNEIPDTKIVLESQLLDALAKVRQKIATGVTLEFEENFEPPHDTGVSYWGEALAELIGAYVNGARIALLVWVKRWDFHENALEEFWNLLSQRVYEALTHSIPDLKWSSLEIHLLDSIEDFERAAFSSRTFP